MKYTKYQEKLLRDAKNDNISLSEKDLCAFEKLNKIFSGIEVTTKEMYQKDKYDHDSGKITEYRQKPEYKLFFENLKSQGLSYQFIKSESEKLVKIMRELKFVKTDGDSGFCRAAWNRIFPDGPNHISKKSSQQQQKNIVETIDIENKNQSNIEWKQMIFFGAPGTGKSTAVKKYTREDESKEKEDRVFRTTFHPDYDYSTFVGAYKPCPGNAGEPPITYKFEEQIFVRAYLAAWKAFCEKEKDPIWLVIEEINRGNCAQIFGDIFQLLDRTEIGFSKFPINCNRDLAHWLRENKTYRDLVESKNPDVPGYDKLYIPPTLSIVATMNTSDQSLFPMDSAFKRRWHWEYIRINTDKDNNDAASYQIALKCSNGIHRYLWIDFIKKVNEKILVLTSSEDKQLGTYFITGSIDTDDFTGKVMFYLWNDICKEEYLGNGNNFMQSNCTPPVRENTKEFTFNNLYEGDEKRRGDILKGFMDYLEVHEVNDYASEKAAEGETPLNTDKE